MKYLSYKCNFNSTKCKVKNMSVKNNNIIKQILHKHNRKKTVTTRASNSFNHIEQFSYFEEFDYFKLFDYCELFNYSELFNRTLNSSITSDRLIMSNSSIISYYSIEVRVVRYFE